MPTKPTSTVRSRRATTVKVEEAPHPLAHLIPDQEFATKEMRLLGSDGNPICPENCTEHQHGGTYLSRDVHGRNDLSLLRYARRCDPPPNVKLYGPPGPGKTTLIMAYCATFKIPLVTINAFGGIDPNTFFGQWAPKSGVDVAEVMRVMGDVQSNLPAKERNDMSVVMPIVMAILGQDKFQWIYSDVVEVIRQDGFLFIDEANYLGGKVSAVFNSLFDRRRQITILEKGNEVIKAGPRFQAAIAYNPETEGSRPLPDAFQDRFGINVPIDYDRDVEEGLLSMYATLDMGEKLRNGVQMGEIRTPVSTRKLMDFEKFAWDMDLEFAIQNLVASFHKDERDTVMGSVRMFEDDFAEQLTQLHKLADEGDDEQ